MATSSASRTPSRKRRRRQLPNSLLALVSLLYYLAGRGSWHHWQRSNCVPSLALASLSTRETETGVIFPSGLGGQDLVAVGVRSKLGGAVKVYAVGLYLDRRSKLWGRPTTADELLAAAPGKASLRIVITSGLATNEKIAGALQEAVQPRLKGLSAARAQAVTKELGDFLVQGPALGKGAVLVFALDKSGLRVEIGAAYKVEMKCPELALALLATYVDARAVAPAFRDAVFQGIIRADGDSGAHDIDVGQTPVQLIKSFAQHAGITPKHIALSIGVAVAVAAAVIAVKSIEV